MSPEAPRAQSFCPECGARAVAGQKFCRYCGSDLTLDGDDLAATVSDDVIATAPVAEAPAAVPSTPAPASTVPAPVAPTPAPAVASTAPVSAGPPSAPPASITMPGPYIPPDQTMPAGPLLWPAWVGAGACGILAIANGVSWFGGGFNLDGFDLPVASLISDNATGGVALGAVLLVVALVGLGSAVIKPEPRMLTTTFLAVGAVSSILVAWYMVRVVTSLEGIPLLDALWIGFWLAVVGSFGVLGSGLVLLVLSRRT